MMHVDCGCRISDPSELFAAFKCVLEQEKECSELADRTRSEFEITLGTNKRTAISINLQRECISGHQNVLLCMNKRPDGDYINEIFLKTKRHYRGWLSTCWEEAVRPSHMLAYINLYAYIGIYVH